MFGLLSLFGRSKDIQRLDDALRAAGLHPAVVPEAVKLTVLKLLGDCRQDPSALGEAAALLGYLMLGPDDYAEATGARAGAAAEARVEAAVAAGDSLDAQLVLLTLQARVAQPAVVQRFGLEAED
ncbi:hypothetical protein [Caenispirillum bisanense]|uniref:Uncharacterized protein n=1 Tax=Caenispirillum bisanense TaxID=414052 RepID=A0A286GZ40_9PROT|nr:hypothetical protein [Caenispirillum bisanense]SOE00732.1 hypothetical protein SAMN05421508_1149 [Caenispirillum bisanense]